MKITDLLDKRSIELNGKAADKENVLNKMVDLMAKSGKINNIEKRRICKRGRRHYRYRRGNSHTTLQIRCGNKTGTCGNGNS